MPQDDPAIAISATFTAEALRPALEFWMRELGLGYEVRFAGYNQVFQELLDPGGVFAANSRGVNVVLVKADDWPQGGTREFLTALEGYRGEAPLIVVDCPGRNGWQPMKSAGRHHWISDATAL